jgi:hypothetical protein
MHQEASVSMQPEVNQSREWLAVGGNGKRQDKHLSCNDQNATQCLQRKRNARPVNPFAPKVRQTNKRQKEIHRKALNERR